MDLPDGTKVRKGAAEAIEQYVKSMGGTIPADLHEPVSYTHLDVYKRQVYYRS